MGVDIIAAIIIAVASLAATSISAGVSSSQNKKNRAEAKKLADIQRKDELEQAKIQNRLAARELRLGRAKLAASNREITEDTATIEEQKQVAQANARSEFVKGIGAKVNESKVKNNTPSQSVLRWGI